MGTRNDGAAEAPRFGVILRLEQDSRPSGGPMVISGPRDVDPLSMAFVAAGAERGLPVNPDFNGAELDGVGLTQSSIRDGARHGVVAGYLRPALSRANLTVATGTPVGRLLVEGTRVTGVRLAGPGGRRVRARRSFNLHCMRGLPPMAATPSLD